MPCYWRPLAVLHLVVLFAGAELAHGQVEVWEVQRVGQKTPLEISAGMGLGRDNDLFRFANIFTISEEGNGNRLDHFRIPLDGSVPVETRTIVTSDVVFGLSQKVGYMPSGEAVVSYIDDGRVMAQHSTDGGRTWNGMTVRNQANYGETQIGTSMSRSILSAYNFRAQKVEIYAFNDQMRAWSYLGTPPTGFVCAGVLGGPRVTLALEKKEEVFTLGWGEVVGLNINYFVQEFYLSGMQPKGPRISFPINFRSDRVTEVQMESQHSVGAVLTVSILNRWSLFAFDGKTTPPRVVQRELGSAPARVVGGSGLAFDGTTLYAAVTKPDGKIDLYRSFLAAILAEGGLDPVEDLPALIDAIENPENRSIPFSFERYSMYDPSRPQATNPQAQTTAQVQRSAGLQLRFPGSGSLRIADFQGCVSGRTRLCNNRSRFEVSARWTDPQGNTGSGRAVPLSGDTGYFWFFNDANIEMVIKVLNGCTVNQRFWVFAGGLTNVEVEITVRDSQTGAVKTYRNPQGTAFQPIQDTSAFEGCAAGASLASEASSTLFDVSKAWSIEPQQGNCAPSQTALCLNGNRFRVEANWRTSDGNAGSGKAIRLTEDSGYFWFFNASNVELVTKVLNACSFNARHWVFAAGLTDVEVELVVTDTVSGAVSRYRNPQKTAFAPIQDTSAFSTCP